MTDRVELAKPPMRDGYLKMMRAHVDEGGQLSHRNGCDLLAEVERLRAPALGVAWLPMSEAKKNGRPILLQLKNPIPNDREDLRKWDGLTFVGRHSGLADDGFDIGWHFAAPVGHGGFPDEWFVGWRPINSSAPIPQPPGEEGLLEQLIADFNAYISRAIAGDGKFGAIDLAAIALRRLSPSADLIAAAEEALDVMEYNMDDVYFANAVKKLRAALRSAGGE